jgi:hypothetical protein
VRQSGAVKQDQEVEVEEGELVCDRRERWGDDTWVSDNPKGLRLGGSRARGFMAEACVLACCSPSASGEGGTTARGGTGTREGTRLSGS